MIKKLNIIVLFVCLSCSVEAVTTDGIIYDVSGATKASVQYNNCDLWIWDGTSSSLAISAYTPRNKNEYYGCVPGFESEYYCGNRTSYYYLYCNSNSMGKASSSSGTTYLGISYAYKQSTSISSSILQSGYNILTFQLMGSLGIAFQTPSIYISTQNALLQDTIYFDANGGKIPAMGNMGKTLEGHDTGLSTNQQTGYVVVTQGQPYFKNMSSDCPLKNGSTFKGWYTSKNGGEQVYDSTGAYVVGNYWDNNGKWKGTSNVTLYAHWNLLQYSISATSTNGTITGCGTYYYGDTATLTAIPNVGYHFAKWSDGYSNNPRSVIIISDTTFVAEFASEPKLTILSSNEELGSASVVEKLLTYSKQLFVLFTLPNSWTNPFVWDWTNTGTGYWVPLIKLEDTKYVYLAPSDHLDMLIANFPNGYTISNIDWSSKTAQTTDMHINERSCLSVESDQDHAPVSNMGCSEICSISDIVKISANPTDKGNFDTWSDGVTMNPRYVMVSSDSTIIANFTQNQYTITTVSTCGTITGGGTYSLGDTAILAVIPNEGCHFTQWSDGNIDNPRQVVVTQDSTFKAIFIDIKCGETVNCTVINASPYGTVSFTGEVIKDSNISLKATAPECSKFVKWLDGDTSNPRSLTITQDSTLTAIFEKIQFNIILETEDESKGEVDGE